MRTFLRRILVIFVLLLLIYLVYGRINPTGAEKMSEQLSSINLPRSSSKDSVTLSGDTVTQQEDEENIIQDALNEVGQNMSGDNQGNLDQIPGEQDVIAEEEIPAIQEADAQQPTSEQNEDGFDRRAYLESDTEESELQPTKNPTPVDDLDPGLLKLIDSGGEQTISDDEMEEIKEILNSLLE